MSASTLTNNVGEILKENSCLNIVWNVADFFSLPEEMGYRIESPVFTFFGMSWFIRLFPNGEAKNDREGWIGLFLVRGIDSGGNCFINFTLGIRRVDGTDCNAISDEGFFNIGEGWGYSKYIQRSVLKRKITQVETQGTVTFFCRLETGFKRSKEAATQCTQNEGQFICHYSL